ncbi:MAG: hypothetical protein LBQ12_04160 [Deltaproteobacteria bacterium]|nr:hypothetical protein [Deltaproteobacteria bacterium]
MFLVERTKIVLLSREGMSGSDIGNGLRLSPDTVGKWRRRRRKKKWRKRIIGRGAEGLLYNPPLRQTGELRLFGRWRPTS